MTPRQQHLKHQTHALKNYRNIIWIVGGLKRQEMISILIKLKVMY